MMDELKNRIKTLVQGVDEAEFLVRSVPYSFEEKAAANLDSDGKDILKIIDGELQKLSSFTAPDIEAACRGIAEAHRAGKLGKVMMPFRAAITGKTVSPSIPHAAEVLGKDETLARIKFALAA
jgi:glutamyl-tRNA synthetase